MKNLENNLYNEISKIIENARNQVRRNVNSTLVITYWQIGKLIVKDELNGNYRADYGKEILQTLSVQLTNNFGKEFDLRNLQFMKQFYRSFSNMYSLRTEVKILKFDSF